MMTSDPLIEALVRLCDEFCELHRVHGPNATEVIQGLTGLYHTNGVRIPPRYQTLLSQAETMIKQHYGVTQLDNDILEDLLEDMWNRQETVND